MGITHSARYAMCGKPSRLAGMRSINGQQVARDRSCIWISWMFIKAIIIITIAWRQCVHISVCVCVCVGGDFCRPVIKLSHRNLYVSSDQRPNELVVWPMI